MKIKMRRLLLALRLFRCALFHGLIERRGGVRCRVCAPVRKRRNNPPKKEVLM